MTQHTAHHIPCDPYEQDWERGTLRRIHDPEGRAPHGAAIFIGAIVMWLVILAGAAIWAAGIF